MSLRKSSFKNLSVSDHAVMMVLGTTNDGGTLAIAVAVSARPVTPPRQQQAITAMHPNVPKIDKRWWPYGRSRLEPYDR
jgi:hypothetical protein